MKKALSLALALILVPFVSFAQEDAASSSAALGFVQNGRNAALEGMGGAGLASSSSIAWASFNNVAVVPFSSSKGDIALNYQLWQPTSTNYINFGGAFNVKEKLGLAFGLTAGMDKAYDVTDESAKTTGSFKPMDLQANFGLSYRFVQWVSLGVNARYAMEKIADGYTLSAILCDAFLMGRFSDFSAALGVTNLGTKASYGKSAGVDTKYDVPSAVALGLDYAPVFGKHGIEINADMRYTLAGLGFGAAVGGGYTWNDILSLRAGYCYGGKAIASHANIGLGVKFSGLHVDFAYYLAGKDSPVANSMSVALGYAF